MGTVTCIGCREQLERCACAQVGEAGQAALLTDYDKTSGQAEPELRRCSRCNALSVLDGITNLCPTCTLETELWT